MSRTARNAAPPHSFSPTFIPRLSYRVHEFSTAPMVLVQAAIESDHDFFLDTSIIDFTASSDAWDLLLAANNAYLVPGIVRELLPWLERHAEHPMSGPVLHSDPRLNFVRQADLAPSIWDGIHFYFNLLVRRKQVMSAVELRLQRELGRDPTLEEVRHEVQTSLGERAYLLGKKTTQASLADLSHADEELVTMAFAHAVQTGRPTMILTRDQDVLEQLYKLTVLVDFDYRSMLLADSYLLHFASYRPRHFPLDEDWLKEAFVDAEENVQFERSPGLEEAVLPPKFQFVPVSCVRIAGATTQLSFGAETRMKEILSIKGRTGGLNTDRLGGRNCHLSLWPLPVRKPLQSVAVIAVDRRVRLSDGLSIGLLDINRVMSTNDPLDVI